MQQTLENKHINKKQSLLLCKSSRVPIIPHRNSNAVHSQWPCSFVCIAVWFDGTLEVLLSNYWPAVENYKMFQKQVKIETRGDVSISDDLRF